MALSNVSSITCKVVGLDLRVLFLKKRHIVGSTYFHLGEAREKKCTGSKNLNLN